MDLTPSQRPPRAPASRPAEPPRRRRTPSPLRLTLTAAAIALVLTAALTLTARPAEAQDNRPSVQFAEVTYVIQENDTSGLFINVTITPALSTASRVKFTTAGISTRNVDYALGGLTKVWSGPNHWSATTEYVDLPAGATSVTLKFAAVPDRLTEGNENAVLSLTSIDAANAPYKIGNPASTEVVVLDNLTGPNPDSAGVSGALPWTATLTVKDVSHERGSSPMVVRKQKNSAGQYVSCTGNTGEYGEGIFAANERCQNGFVYERVALSEVTGTTSFPMVGCKNDHKNGRQCYPPHALSDNGFSDGGSAHRVLGVVLSGGTLSLSFDRPLSDALKAVAKLTVDGSTELRLADATQFGSSYHWGNTGLTWTTDPAQSVSLRLERVSQQRGGEGPGSNEEAQRDPLTASFETVPAKHDGQSAFTLNVRLSETVGKFSRSPRASSFAVTRGRVTNVEQVGAGLWRVTVQPASSDDVTVTLAGGRDCDDEPSGAVCAPDGRALSNTSSATIGGPPPQVEQLVEVQQEPEPQSQQTAEAVETPGPVVNLQLTVKGKKVTVNWDAPASGGAVDNYIVHIKNMDAGKGKDRKVAAGKTTTTFRNLEPGATYRVWVRAQNDAGKGERVHARVTLPE